MLGDVLTGYFGELDFVVMEIEGDNDVALNLSVQDIPYEYQKDSLRTISIYELELEMHPDS